MIQSRSLYVSLVGAVAWSSTVADTIFCILEAASLTSGTDLVHTAAAAGALDVLSLCCIGFYTVQDVRRIHGFMDHAAQARRVLIAVSILVSTIALVVSVAWIIVIKSRWEAVTTASSKAPVSDWNGHISGHIVMWVISCISQITLYTSTFWQRKAPKVQPVTISGPRDSVMSELRPDLRPSRPSNLYIKDITPLPLALAGLPSPTFSERSSHSLQSFRDSLRHVVRPVTSRTTLISRPSFNRDARSIYSDTNSVNNFSRSDGFDSWDTSSVSLQARDTVLQTAPSKGTTLEPIPGSRPNSPARALDGPFLSELPEEEDEELPQLAPPPRMIPDTSRPSSPTVSEAHIHPLFRTESPTPAPAATPGTSILASPLSTHAISCPTRPFNRMRSNSRAASPSPLNHARSFTRDRSMSLQSHPHSRSHSHSRSPSPPSRAMTPPIPDFVLNSSPRSSMSGSRRVQLQYSPDR